MVDRLTKEQEEKIQVYLKKWLDIGYRTETMDKDKAMKAAHFFYKKYLKVPTPEIHYVESPKAAQILCNKLVNNIDLSVTPDAKLEYFNVARSNWWMSYYSFYDYVLHILFPEKVKNFQLFTEFLTHSENFHMLWTFDQFAIICDFPKEINLDEEFKLHSNFTGALVYRDGYTLYAQNGEILNKDTWIDKTKKFHSSLGKEIFKTI